MHKRISDIKAEENDIAVVHDVILAFAADKPRFLAGGKRAFFDKRLIWHYFGADKAAFEIGVDFARRSGGFRAALYCPGADFRFARGEEGYQPEQRIGCLYQLCKPGFGNADIGKVCLLFLLVQLAQLGFGFGTNGDNLGVFALYRLLSAT